MKKKNQVNPSQKSKNLIQNRESVMKKFTLGSDNIELLDSMYILVSIHLLLVLNIHFCFSIIFISIISLLSFYLFVKKKKNIYRFFLIAKYVRFS